MWSSRGSPILVSTQYSVVMIKARWQGPISLYGISLESCRAFQLESFRLVPLEESSFEPKSVNVQYSLEKVAVPVFYSNKYQLYATMLPVSRLSG